jgi:predicted alternative tryptophan synthase beta-subunit
MKGQETKITLTEKEMPTTWYNILPDLPKPLPPLLHPGTAYSSTSTAFLQRYAGAGI